MGKIVLLTVDVGRSIYDIIYAYFQATTGDFFNVNWSFVIHRSLNNYTESVLLAAFTYVFSDKPSCLLPQRDMSWRKI